jgi:hypothetical protein
MPIYFNITEARNHLMKNKIVYTLRERRRMHLGKLQIRQGSYRQSKVLGKSRVSFVKSINNDNELLPYVKQSGFGNIEDWRKKAGKGKYLYKVELI